MLNHQDQDTYSHQPQGQSQTADDPGSLNPAGEVSAQRRPNRMEQQEDRHQDKAAPGTDKGAVKPTKNPKPMSQKYSAGLNGPIGFFLGLSRK